jgi:shikimate kinase
VSAILVGLPASGKSSVGRYLARELALDFVDLDAVIEESSGQSISQIFAASGEDGFRELETKALGSTISEAMLRGAVIALGGGAILREENQRLIRESGIPVIYLIISTAQALGRARGSSHRPLMNDDPAKKIAEMAQIRNPIYQSLSTISVSTENRKPLEIARELVTLLGKVDA